MWSGIAARMRSDRRSMMSTRTTRSPHSRKPGDAIGVRRQQALVGERRAARRRKGEQPVGARLGAAPHRPQQRARARARRASAAAAHIYKASRSARRACAGRRARSGRASAPRRARARVPARRAPRRSWPPTARAASGKIGAFGQSAASGPSTLRTCAASHSATRFSTLARSSPPSASSASSTARGRRRSVAGDDPRHGIAEPAQSRRRSTARWNSSTERANRAARAVSSFGEFAPRNPRAPASRSAAGSTALEAAQMRPVERASPAAAPARRLRPSRPLRVRRGLRLASAFGRRGRRFRLLLQQLRAARRLRALGRGRLLRRFAFHHSGFPGRAPTASAPSLAAWRKIQGTSPDSAARLFSRPDAARQGRVKPLPL